MDDVISRQAAIDAIVNTVSRIGLHDNSEVARYGVTFRQREIIDIIESLPSAQPEQLTDAEQRIFLKAIEREEKVCKKVDEEWGSGDEECEINLVHACHEIIRKVKGALWT